MQRRRLTNSAWRRKVRPDPGLTVKVLLRYPPQTAPCGAAIPERARLACRFQLANAL